MDEREIRLRLVEAAARFPVPHKDGFAAGALEAAQKWEEYVLKNSGDRSHATTGATKGTLGLPKK